MSQPNQLPVDIVLRRVEFAQTPFAKAMYVVVLEGELRVLSYGDFGNATVRENLDIDAAGRIRRLTTSRRTTIEEIVENTTADGVLIIADAAAPAKDLLPLVSALHEKCWTLAVVLPSSGYLAGLWPLPCPAPRITEQPELVVTIEPERIHLRITGGEGTTVDGDLRALRDKLHELAASPPLRGRADLVFAIHDRATVGDVVDAMVVMRAQNFVNPRWLSLERLPK